jgi:uncharacterized OsmC-like protein
MVEITIDYQGDLHCEAVHGPSGDKLATDAPVDNQGRGEAFSPTDLVATALGACMATVMGIVARRKGLELAGMKVRVGKTMSADAPRRIARLDVELRVPLAADHPDRGMLEAAALACPVHQSLHPSIVTVLDWQWQG